MFAQQSYPQISNAEPVHMSLIRDRATASYDYADNARRFEGVTARDLERFPISLHHSLRRRSSWRTAVV